jgi:hypothetical protein
MTGARYEIAVDGLPRSCRDAKEIAIDAAEHLKVQNPNVPVTVRDLETGDTNVIKSQPLDRWQAKFARPIVMRDHAPQAT